MIFITKTVYHIRCWSFSFSCVGVTLAEEKTPFVYRGSTSPNPPPRAVAPTGFFSAFRLSLWVNRISLIFRTKVKKVKWVPWEDFSRPLRRKFFFFSDSPKEIAFSSRSLKKKFLSQAPAPPPTFTFSSSFSSFFFLLFSHLRKGSDEETYGNEEGN